MLLFSGIPPPSKEIYPRRYIRENRRKNHNPVRMGRTVISSESEIGVNHRIAETPTAKMTLTVSMMNGMVFSTGCFGLDFFVCCFLNFRIFLLGLPCRPYMVVSLLLEWLEATRVIESGSMTVVSSPVFSGCGFKICLFLCELIQYSVSRFVWFT